MTLSVQENKRHKRFLEAGRTVHSSILAWRCHGQRSLVGYSPRGHRVGLSTQQVEVEQNACYIWAWHLRNSKVLPQLAFPVFPELPTSYLRLPEQKLESGYTTLPPVADTGTQSTRCLTKHRLSLWILLSTVLSVATPIALSWQARRNPFAIPHSKGCRLVPIPASDCIPFSFFPSAWTCMCAC